MCVCFVCFLDMENKVWKPPNKWDDSTELFCDNKTKMTQWFLKVGWVLFSFCCFFLPPLNLWAILLSFQFLALLWQEIVSWVQSSLGQGLSQDSENRRWTEWELVVWFSPTNRFSSVSTGPVAAMLKSVMSVHSSCFYKRKQRMNTGHEKGTAQSLF